MLQFPRVPTAQTEFPDHRDPQIAYQLPDRLILSSTPAGEPDFLLLSYRGDGTSTKGGLLQFKLRQAFPSPAGSSSLSPNPSSTNSLSSNSQSPNPSSVNSLSSPAIEHRAVTFESGEVRLRLRSPNSDEQLGEWHPAMLANSEIVLPALSLTANEAMILQDLLTREESSIEVDLRLRYRGLVEGLPWLVTINAADLKLQLAAHLGNEAATIDRIVAAFLSLPDSILQWQPLEAGAEKPARDELLIEVAFRAIDRCFQQEAPNQYRLRLEASEPASEPAAEPQFLSWDLLPPRQETRLHTLHWSIRELYDQLSEPLRQKLFPAVDSISLFGSTTIHVINTLPCDRDALRELRVGLRFSGITGVPDYREAVFNGGSNLQEFKVVYPRLTPFRLDYQLSGTIAPQNGGWLVPWKRDFVSASSSVIVVSREAIAIDWVRVEAEPEVFTKASAIDIALFSDALLADSPRSDLLPSDAAQTQPLSQLTLTAEKTTGWIVLPGFDLSAPIFARCVAHSLDGSSTHLLMNRAVSDRSIQIAAYQLEVLQPDEIRLTWDAETAAQFAYVAVMLEDKYQELTAGEPKLWRIYRSSLFDPVRFRYQIHYVAYDAAGNTRPIATTKWAIAEGNSLLIRPPHPMEVLP